jgi:hypothetical protein
MSHCCACASGINHFPTILITKNAARNVEIFTKISHGDPREITYWYLSYTCASQHSASAWITNAAEALFVAPFFGSENAFTFRCTFHPIRLLLDGLPYGFARTAPPLLLCIGILRIYVRCNRLRMTVRSLRFLRIGSELNGPRVISLGIIFREDPVLFDAKRRRYECYALNSIVVIDVL